MSKITAAGIAAVFACMTALTGCGGSSAATTAAPAATTAAPAETTAAAAAETKAAEAETKAEEKKEEAGDQQYYGIVPEGRMKKIIDKGVLTMATEPYFAPYEFIDSSKQGDEQYVGADIEIAKFIADKLGVQLQVVPLEFSAVLSSVPDGKYDIAISGLAYTPERAEAMELSEGYYFTNDTKGYSLLIQEKDKDVIKSPADLAGKTIVYQSGSLQEALSKAQVDEAACKEVKRTSSSNDAYLTVQEGKADAAVVSVESASLYAEANPGLYIVEEFRFDFPKELDGTRIGTQKGETALISFINCCIEDLRSQGKIDEWFATYEEYAASLGV
ncbi:MAG: transporter substrate-binding domain-containing protein [Stomatobaculum sp.]|nr:transporter substrate-binding domain-containing protein [Stomatobaculum sp.]